MKRNILYIHDCISSNQSEIDILKKIYNVDNADNIINIYKAIESKQYQYIIIDLEFSNKTGDKLSINLRKKYKKLPPLIGLYSFYKPGLYKNDYNLACFNNISTIPVLNWEKFLNETKPIYLNTSKKWKEWLEKEIDFSNYLYKNLFGIKRKGIKF